MTDASTPTTTESTEPIKKKKHVVAHKLPDDAKAALQSPDFPSQQSAAVQARWLVERAAKADLEFLFKEIDYQEGLDLIARMRGNCEIAGHILNSRITHADADARCKTCNGKRKPGRQWYLLRPFKHPTTCLIINNYFCSIECVVMENQKNQGVAGISDRGMLPQDNPKNHPHNPNVQTVKQPNTGG